MQPNPQIVNLGDFPLGLEHTGSLFDFEGEDLAFQMVYLDGSEQTPAAIDSVDIGGLVIYGQGIITLHGADYRVGAGYFFFIPKNVMHRLRSVGGAFQFCIFRPRG